jgi:hypothetical protein
MCKCIGELERIYGIKNGGDRKSERDNLVVNKTQTDLAENIGITTRQLQDYKKLNDLIPELQSLIENGSMKATVGYKIYN